MPNAKFELGCGSVMVVAAAALTSAAGAAAAAPSYEFIKQIPVAGDSGWDYLSIDPDARRLYIAHTDHIDVIDIDHDTVAGTIANTPGVHGFAIAHKLGRGFASDGQSSQISVVDLKSLATSAHVETGTGPDAIVYHPKRNQVYSFNGRGQSSTVVDAESAKVVATLTLPGKPEFAVVDPEADRVYVNIEDKNLIASIDAHTHTIAALWQISPCESPSGLAIDIAHHRLFVGCHNQRMVMVNAENGAVVASVPIGRSVDANVFDPGTQLAFSSNGDGTLTVAREDSPDSLSVLQNVMTQPGARTMALDPKTHNIYLVTADRAPPAAVAAGAAPARPGIVPGSFRILVYGPAAH